MDFNPAQRPWLLSLPLTALVVVALAVYVTLVPPVPLPAYLPGQQTQICGTTVPNGIVYIGKDLQFKVILEGPIQADVNGNWQSANSYNIGQVVYIASQLPAFNYKQVTLLSNNPLQAQAGSCAVYFVGTV